MLSRLVQSHAQRTLERRLADAGAAPTLPIAFTAQHAEDVLLLELFGDHVGYFVEAGALNGVAQSNTYVLEAIGWKGLLVEPIPDLAAQCAANRPNSTVKQVALTEPGHPPTSTFIHYTSDDEQDASRLTTNTNARAPRGKNAAAEHIEVKLATLDELLEDVPRIDLLILDIEGLELPALRGVDLEAKRPTVIMVEDQTLGADDELPSYLDKAGYEHCGWIAWNRLYVRRDEADLVARARALLGA